MKISLLCFFSIALLKLAVAPPGALNWNVLNSGNAVLYMTEDVAELVRNNAMQHGIIQVTPLLYSQLRKALSTIYCLYKGESVNKEAMLFSIAITRAMGATDWSTDAQLMKIIKTWDPLTDMHDKQTAWKGLQNADYVALKTELKKLAVGLVKDELKEGFELCPVDYGKLTVQHGQHVQERDVVIYSINVVGDEAGNTFLAAYVRVEYTDEVVITPSITDSRLIPELMLMIEMENEAQTVGVSKTTKVAKPNGNHPLPSPTSRTDALEDELKAELRKYACIANESPVYTLYEYLQLKTETSTKYFFFLHFPCLQFTKPFYTYISFSKEENQKEGEEIKFVESEKFFKLKDDMIASNEEISQRKDNIAEYSKFIAVDAFEKRMSSEGTAKKYKASLAAKTIPISLADVKVGKPEITPSLLGTYFKYTLEKNQMTSENATPNMTPKHVCAFKGIFSKTVVYKVTEDVNVIC